eukprot:TRINITY_DN17494_c0_g1_i1.p1 TRINITY_DN17494_c0_g1~~TRINITY_DN17494_c0_g1_i1.p1  ORF type:complete len:218 (+),score=40.27 TRINITY_DN17494_c0_g1_i1:58-711(+)
MWQIYLLVLIHCCTHVFAAGGCCNYDCKCVQEHGSRNFCQEWSCDVRVDPCFPASSILNGAEKTMSLLKIGDKALSPSNSEDSVYNWIHRDEEVKSTFLRLETDDGVLQVSPEHLVYINGEYRFAKRAQVGDVLQKVGDETARITAITSFVDQGVYAPFTETGEMFVDGFRVSCYAYYESHDVAHLLMKPLLFLGGESEGIHWWPQVIKSVYDWANQ